MVSVAGGLTNQSPHNALQDYSASSFQDLLNNKGQSGSDPVTSARDDLQAATALLQDAQSGGQHYGMTQDTELQDAVLLIADALQFLNTASASSMNAGENPTNSAGGGGPPVQPTGGSNTNSGALAGGLGGLSTDTLQEIIQLLEEILSGDGQDLSLPGKTQKVSQLLQQLRGNAGNNPAATATGETSNQGGEPVRTENYASPVIRNENALSPGQQARLPTNPGKSNPIGTQNNVPGLAERKQQMVDAMDKAGVPKAIQSVVIAEAMQEGDLSPSAMVDGSGNVFNVPFSVLQAGGFQGSPADAADPARIGDVAVAIANVNMTGADSPMGSAGNNPSVGDYGASIVRHLEIVRGGGAAESDPTAYGANDFASGILDVARQIQTDPSLLTNGTRVAPNTPGW